MRKTSLIAFLGAFWALTGTVAAQVRIVVIGDSNIDGKGVSRSEAYPAQLEAALKARGHNVVVTNAGRNGDTTERVLARLDSDVPSGTQLAIVSVGINDLFAGSTPQKMRENVKMIDARLKARGIRTLLFGPAQRLGAFQGDIESRADMHVESPGQQRNQYHLNAAGYAHVVKRTLPTISSVVKTLGR